MKPGRQNAILEIISEKDIETQNQLMQELAARGVKSTQATLSRDIKDMRLVKELGPSGNYRYVVAAKTETADLDMRLKKILRESLVSYDVAQNLLVIRTLPGLASAACSAFDGDRKPCRHPRGGRHRVSRNARQGVGRQAVSRDRNHLLTAFSAAEVPYA